MLRERITSPEEQALFDKLMDDNLSPEQQMKALEEYIAGCVREEQKVIAFNDFTQVSIGDDKVSRWEYQMRNGKYTIGHTVAVTNKGSEMVWTGIFERRAGAPKRFEEWETTWPSLQEILQSINRHHQRGRINGPNS